MKNYFEQKIEDYLKGSLSPEDKSEFENLLLTDKELQGIVKEQKKLHQKLTSLPLHRPSMNFTSVVMQNLDSHKVKSQFDWKGISLVLGFLTCILITFISLTELKIQPVTVADKVELFNKEFSIPLLFDTFDPRYILNGMLFLGFIAAMLYFDKIVLRPLFEKRWG